MAISGKNTKVDTPFDNYKERSKEPDGIHVGRVSAAPFFLGQKAVIFLVGIVLTLSMKCESFGSFFSWSALLALMILIWSFSLRLFVPQRNLCLNIFLNFIYVTLFGIGYSYLASSFMAEVPALLTGNLISVADMYYLTPMAIAFAVMCDHEYERPNFKWNILLPTGVGMGAMLLATVICKIAGVTKGFVSIMLASLILFILSYVLSALLKHGVYFSPAPQHNIFTDVPIREPLEFRKFMTFKLILTLLSFFAVSVAGLCLNMIPAKYGLELFSPLIVALIFGGSMFLVFKLPMFKSNEEKKELRDLVRYYEYPVVSVFVSIPLSGNFSYLKYAIYILLVVCADILLTGLIISIPRRLILSNRSRNTEGAPAILLIISLIVMVGTVFFVIY